MEYGKYGVVRNNYYTLTLTKVNGNGTPWYPGGGPEDPDEEEDIDKKGAYLHFEIKVAPWIYWTTNFEISINSLLSKKTGQCGLPALYFF